MSVKRKTVRNDICKIEKSIDSLRGKKVVVGHLGGGEQAWLAAIHEYEMKIEVTPEMRAWLHANGLHLKKETQYITIPERSFLRSGYDTHHKEVIYKTNHLLGDVIGGTMSADKFCNLVGTSLRDKIREFAIDLKNPKNHPFTIERKGSSNPLVTKAEGGDLIKSIVFEVEG